MGIRLWTKGPREEEGGEKEVEDESLLGQVF